MDRTERLHGSAEVTDEAFQESLARLSLYLATRRPPLQLPPPVRRRAPPAWPYVLLIAVAAGGAAGYRYDLLIGGDVPSAATPRIADSAPSAPPLVLASIAVAAASTPAAPPGDNPTKPDEQAPGIDVAAAIPPPPPPEPAVIVPPAEAAPGSLPEVALSWTEVVEIQKRLVSLGIDPGPIDGLVGPRTMAGVQRYEERLGGPITGKADRRLLKLLQQEAGTLSTLEAHAR